IKYFHYLDAHRVLVCRTCTTSVTKRRIRVHLQAAPHRLTKDEIDKAERWAVTVDIIENPDDIKTPSDDCRPIEELGQPGENGYQCTFGSKTGSSCPFVGTDLGRIREHLKAIHRWDQGLRPGRQAAPERVQDGPWKAGVYYQRFFTQGPRSEYFEVAAGRHLQRENQLELVQEDGVREAAGRFVAKAAGIRKKEVENVDNPDEFLAPNAWVNRLGAARHLQAFGEK
ncbi:hypothetical protein LY78DRAFT_540452, partial [Colletotrichum sublineola]